MEKIFNQKNFNNFVWSPLGSRGNIYINFCFKLTFRCLQPDIVPIICHRCQFAAGVVDNGGNLPPAPLTPAANLPPVSLTPVATTQGELLPKFAAGVVDTGGKFSTGVVDTGGAP
jgi:hypothetical protein